MNQKEFIKKAPCFQKHGALDYRIIDLWFESTLFFYKKITNRKNDWLSMVEEGGPELRSGFVCYANLRIIDLWFESTLFF